MTTQADGFRHHQHHPLPMWMKLVIHIFMPLLKRMVNHDDNTSSLVDFIINIIPLNLYVDETMMTIYLFDDTITRH